MTEKTSLNRKDALLCGLLAVLCIFLFREIIFHGHLLFGADFFSLHLGTKQFLYDEIHKHGSIPFWNPYVFGGIPFWAHFESTIFYPLDVLFWFVPPERAYGYTVFLHFYLSGLLTYLLSRSLGMKRAGAFGSSLCFTFSGLMTATIYDGQMFRVQAFMWLPLVTYFLNRALSSERPLYPAAVAGLFWGIQIMAGAPQDAFYTLIAGCLFVLLMSHKRPGLPDPILRSAKIFAILCMIGLGIAAIQIIPSFELVKQSVRGTWSNVALMTLGSYPPEGIITWVLPHFYGRFAANDYWVSDVPWSVPLYNLYVGVLPVVLLLFQTGRGSGDRRILVFAIALAGLSFVLALGSNTPVYKFITFLPVFDKIRAPAKIILLWVFAMSLLAGHGLDGLLDRSKRSMERRLGAALGILLVAIALDLVFLAEKSLLLKLFSPFILDHTPPSRMSHAQNTILAEWHRLTLLSGVIVFLCFLWVRRLLRRPVLMTLLCGILFMDLAYVNRGAVRHDDRIYSEAARVKNELEATLGQDESVFRVGSFRSGWGANFEMYLGYQSVGGYNPLFLHRYYEYINHYRFYGEPVPEGWIIFFYETRDNGILMDLLNVKYEICHKTKSYGFRETSLPRAFLVPRCKLLEKDKTLEQLTAPGFDPRRVVFLEATDFRGVVPEHDGFGTPGEARIVSYRPDHILLSVNAASPGFLLLSEMYYPGWEAFLDGESRPVLRGNHMFRVIEIPEGTHLVRLVFDPLSIKIGVAVTLVTLLILLIWTAFRLLRKNC
jgi:hypothetical protein